MRGPEISLGPPHTGPGMSVPAAGEWPADAMPWPNDPRGDPDAPYEKMLPAVELLVCRQCGSAVPAGYLRRHYENLHPEIEASHPLLEATS